MADREASVQAPLILGPEDAGRVVSAEEFASAEFVGAFKSERVGGRLTVMAPMARSIFALPIPGAIG